MKRNLYMLKKKPAEGLADLRLAIRTLRAERYDVIIDAQGLMKSALAGRFAKGGVRHGFSRATAREGIAAFTYDRGHEIPEVEHMATRIRRLFARALGYPEPTTPADAGLEPERFAAPEGRKPSIVLIHGTSWTTKTWTVEGWRRLAAEAAAAGYETVLFAHGAREEARVAAIAAGIDSVRRFPPGGVMDIVPVLAHADGVVTVDTGLGHLAAALDRPVLGLYGPSNPGLTGLSGRWTRELVSRRDCAPCEKMSCAIRPDFGEGPPCLADHAPGPVFAALRELMARSAAAS